PRGRFHVDASRAKPNSFVYEKAGLVNGFAVHETASGGLRSKSGLCEYSLASWDGGCFSISFERSCVPETVTFLLTKQSFRASASPVMSAPSFLTGMQTDASWR